jgi:hypothetical protein
MQPCRRAIFWFNLHDARIGINGAQPAVVAQAA